MMSGLWLSSLGAFVVRHLVRFCSLLALIGVARAAVADDKIDFARDVQPILSDNCYRCHGPDGGSRKADLRLDQPDAKLGPLAPRDGYAVITPGKLDDSVLIMRITSEDDEVRMPPPKSNRHLGAKQID